ncbi:MAG: hypothetical protein Q8O61_16305 [Nocardioides sp.]|nr:hypothetical protein [Nocardioides sp.]
MTTHEKLENTRAAEEARKVTARRAGGSPGRAEEALIRYLASEAFHEKRREEKDQA